METLLIGASIGLAAGITPGPLLLLVITSTLQAGWQAGAVVAAAPLMTDLVVVTATLLALGRLPALALAILGMVGGAVIAYIGMRTLREASTFELVDSAVAPCGSVGRALRRGAAVQFLNPHPWLTWVTVLAPLTIVAWHGSMANAVALVLGFYATLVTANLVVALLVASGGSRLSSSGYRRALVAGGVLLLAVAVGMWLEFGGAMMAALR